MPYLLLQMMFSFLKIGAFAFGGGYAILAFIYSEVVETHQWIDPESFVDIVAIAEMTPGPIAVNAATFVGYDMFGIGGGVLCTLCTLAVPFTLALIVSFYFSKFKETPLLRKSLLGIRPAVIGLIAAALVSVVEISVTTLWDIAFFAVAFLLVSKAKLNPILTLAVCGGLGAVVYGCIIPFISTL